MKQYRAFILCLILVSLTGCVPNSVCGLGSEYPEVIPSPQTVDSLLPTLRWEKFPRTIDLQAGTLSGVNNVSYDLMIWQVYDRFPSLKDGAILVYERQELPEPYHRLETPLLPKTTYLWTVRARFKLNEQVRV